MKYDLEKKVEDDIIKIAKKNNIKKVILFGSRARGNNYERSDIDLAVSGGDALNFYYG
jgi:predicted nucleotidyltransferase